MNGGVHRRGIGCLRLLVRGAARIRGPTKNAEPATAAHIRASLLPVSPLARPDNSGLTETFGDHLQPTSWGRRGLGLAPQQKRRAGSTLLAFSFQTRAASKHNSRCFCQAAVSTAGDGGTESPVLKRQISFPLWASRQYRKLSKEPMKSLSS